MGACTCSTSEHTRWQCGQVGHVTDAPRKQSYTLEFSTRKTCSLKSLTHWHSSKLVDAKGCLLARLHGAAKQTKQTSHRECLYFASIC
jgi:negative regulator of sigma E activity